ncbi:glycoside hydrolase family 32 protein [Marinoscillum sp. MHG1-6]|uniref:glycoside hydrolase family 32 protein n=1 Tax=Marinoscillum sp. MHG1-6 TaxID=2959627 RepID=UPI0021570764|nr:glycoside hydrolase family 32 protein [Marinoscillum sp. MHG1-6]
MIIKIYSTLRFIVIVTLVMVFGCQPAQKTTEENKALDEEKYRPQFHFSPEENWMNDPNGMVYYEGEYHLFYQYYPDSNVWGPMHWGHAVSTDMMNWEHLPIALYPDELGYIFSGSAVIDWNNTSGLGTEDNPPMVAIFTYHDPVGADKKSLDHQNQGIAYSLDKGRTWTKYDNNPVLVNPGITDFRDPKVSWMEEFDGWVMALAVKDHIEFYTSDDLIEWTKESEFGQGIGGHGGVWECPDLFKLKTEDGEERWVLFVSINPGGPQGGSATQYFLGEFDGSNFVPQDSVTRWIDLGADNYAGVTWSDIPAEDGRQLFLGWMSNWDYGQEVPTYKWRSAMTLPRELILTKIGEELILQSKPVEEIKSYLTAVETTSEEDGYVLPDELVMIELNGFDAMNLKASLSNEKGEKVGFTISPESIAFDRSSSGQTDFGKGFAAMHSYENFLEDLRKVQIYIDRASIEIFINDGEFVMTELVFPTQPYSKFVISSGNAEVKMAKVSSIWDEK